MSVIIFNMNIPMLVRQVSPGCRKLLTSSSQAQGSSYLPVISSIRTIVGKSLRDPDVKKPPPFPYKEKKYTMIRSWFDRTTHRFDENSKLIVVDGVVAAGKSAFAKQLAESLDMYYLPDGSMDFYYINEFGYDMRQLNPQLPDSVKSYEAKDFCENPHHPNAANFQIMLYQSKFAQYIDALAHIMNTGQGVVLEKSPYSDFVYIEAMAKEGFISPTAKSVYYDIKRHTIDELMRPHLAIYLDMPVSKIQEKVKERGRPEEQNSKALSTSFLSSLEDMYKRKYLKEISEHAELLIYDWSDGGDVEVVVEDIERIDFTYSYYEKKSSDWNLPKEQAWADARMTYTDQKFSLMTLFNVPRLDCPELVLDGGDWEKWNKVWYSAPGMEYSKGYNAKYGDKNVWWKLGAKTKFSYY